MSTEQAEVVVVGLGVAGEAVGGALAKAGVDVVGIEDTLVGGECPYWGCIPSKMMVRAGNLLAEARRIPGMAGSATVTPDWAPVARRIREEATADWDDTIAVDRFTDAGGRFVRGHAEILGPDRVRVGDTEYTASRGLVLATGTEPVVPPIDGLAETPFWTNHGAIEAEELPASLIVLGGGAIGLEIGQVYARFGVKVTVVEAADRILPMDEPESSELIEDVLVREGLTVHTGSPVTRVTYDDGSGFAVTADGVPGDLHAEKLLVATGRRPRLAPETRSALGAPPRGDLVDDRLRIADRVWAIGDAAGKGAFTHVATYHADIVVREILGEDGPAADHRALPRVTFTDPEVGVVGLTEAAAREAGLTVATGIQRASSTTRGWLHKAGNDGFVKLVADVDAGRLVGATAAGPHGGEVLGALSVAVHARVPITELESMIYAYPTFHRGIHEALKDLRSAG
ncbi:dihydrolipoyl dehydrogenase family protein [Myceligenerans xiligouense]|uniref:Pyruvate/2-oxoglutarate dehydrogenase complex dihydrolipoamide dehydrogenase (E3) component n=1 Tax=Myceligenerans xiligouense TaxID=253184 RepID=A0A3N4ZGG9_9MICO|nr:NAD(P)/FAD-dependent oxidoreductase [Myceligenerans xiligouense]RPF19935.1 pyruvate/2-oxoglutarate dehydrogenase complex dihydrolipoamide dehydrogenase (E3) component [Myceligenerans xiligouense]